MTGLAHAGSAMQCSAVPCRAVPATERTSQAPTELDWTATGTGTRVRGVREVRERKRKRKREESVRETENPPRDEAAPERQEDARIETTYNGVSDGQRTQANGRCTRRMHATRTIL